MATSTAKLNAVMPMDHLYPGRSTKSAQSNAPKKGNAHKSQRTPPYGKIQLRCCAAFS